MSKLRAKLATSIKVPCVVTTEEGKETGFGEFKTEAEVFLEVKKELFARFQ